MKTKIGTMTQVLDEARHYFRTEVMTASDLATMDASTEALEASGIIRNVLPAGASAPDFILPDSDGNCVWLYGELAARSVVLVFYRGGWCPYCRLYLSGLQRLLTQFCESGVRLLTVSPQLPEYSLSTMHNGGFTLSLLSDVGNHAARSFGLTFDLPDELLEVYKGFGDDLSIINGAGGARVLPMPATFIIGQDRRVSYAVAHTDYTRRVDPQHVLEIVRASNNNQSESNQIPH